MDLILLRSFMAVADAGTITEAAERISVTQSALSRRLQQLEAHLGTELFVRGRQGAELTAIGKMVEAEARSLVFRYDQLRQHIREHLQLERGSVKIGGGATVTSYLLPRAIAEFQAAHPGIRFQLKEAGSREIAGDVAAGRLELGLVTMPARSRDLQVDELLEDEIVLVSRRDDPLARKRVVRPRDLLGRAYVGFEGASEIRQIIDSVLRAAGVEIDVVMELRSIPSILQMVLTTGSLAFVSRVSIAAYAELEPIPVRGLSISRKLGMATRQGMPLSTAADAFADLLRRRLR